MIVNMFSKNRNLTVMILLEKSQWSLHKIIFAWIFIVATWLTDVTKI